MIATENEQHSNAVWTLDYICCLVIVRLSTWRLTRCEFSDRLYYKTVTAKGAPMELLVLWCGRTSKA